MDDVRREGRERRRKIRSELGGELFNDGVVKPLTMVHMQGPFLLYVVCVVGCFFSFVFEVLSYTYQNHPDFRKYFKRN